MLSRQDGGVPQRRHQGHPQDVHTTDPSGGNKGEHTAACL